jgi:hypothetical protein
MASISAGGRRKKGRKGGRKKEKARSGREGRWGRREGTSIQKASPTVKICR